MKRLPAFALMLALCLSLTACWEAEAPEAPDFWEVTQEESLPGTTEPEKVSEFTLPYLNAQTLDPIACSDGVQQVVGSLLYEGLFALDEHFVPQPVLCSSFDTSSNGLTYTFRMRENVTFSDGSLFTASDALAALRRAQVSDRYAARFVNVASMRTNRGALVITLIKPDSGLPALLDIPIVRSGTEKELVPLGTGPYWFQSDSEGACLLRKEHWWGSEAMPLERIALAPAKNADTAVYLFSAEAAHLLTADLLSETSASALGNAVMTDAPTTALLFLGFNTKTPALSTPALRAAMGTAFDRSAVVSALLAGHAASAQFPISPSSALYPAAMDAAYDSNAYAEALASDGAEPASIELRLLVNEENSFKVALAEYLAKQFSVAHVTVAPVVLPWSDYLAALERGDFDLWLGEVRLTADWNITRLVGTNGALNYGKFSSADVDKALDAFLKNENETSAAALCQCLASEAPILPIAFKSVTVITPGGVIDGVSPTAAQPLRGFAQWSIHLPRG